MFCFQNLKSQAVSLFQRDLLLGYSDEGGLAFVIERFFIICDNNPPEKPKMVEIIREAYETMLEGIAGLPIRIGEIKEIPLEHEKEYNF